MTYVKGRLAAIGITQPQWWVLHQAVHSEHGATRDELISAHQADLDVGGRSGPRHRSPGGADAARRRRGRTAPDHRRGQGTARHRRAAETRRTGRQHVHADIPDEEYLITLKVLQRMMHNAGGEVTQR
ncbi:MarR family transcriptional regulator [Streptomyces uncialis]|uniref:MarR family transcriptional regulator n=1 Tax=Streptomyces uncialis TaxID=1048205 RepID=UPI0033C25A8F